jgi:hypothetical protein
MNDNSQLVGVAGVHYVASYLSYLGFHAVPTTRNVQGPDLLVSSLDGSKGVSLQVKTTKQAIRTRGRRDGKQPHHYEWAIGWSSSRLNCANLFFALVDLKEFKELPDIFIVPSQVIFDYFRNDEPVHWARFHPPIEDLARYKNNWETLEEALRHTEKMLT